ncbi:MAG TPA: DUF2171 domain-containing protein, partial [Candidatus Limnocylindria bacterium]|nr:DUF2171 domain-containing protein [Candidatus Limnocylindria bacterium]
MRSDYDTQSGYQASQIQAGWDVYGSDGKEIGDVAEVGPNYFVVEKGFLLTKELYIPMSAVASISEDRVELSVTSDAIEDQDWSQPPADDAHVGGYAGSEYIAEDQGAGTATGYGTDTDLGTRDEGTLERREERLQVDKRQTQTGEVRVGKDVVEEQQS